MDFIEIVSRHTDFRKKILVKRYSPRKRPSLCTSNNQFPWGASPHVWTDMNGHSLKPDRDTSWTLEMKKKMLIWIFYSKVMKSIYLPKWIVIKHKWLRRALLIPLHTYSNPILEVYLGLQAIKVNKEIIMYPLQLGIHKRSQLRLPSYHSGGIYTGNPYLLIATECPKSENHFQGTGLALT